MTDTISRQAAIDAIQKLNIPEDMCVFEIISHIEIEIATLPKAQLTREGKWIRNDNGTYSCNLCHSWIPGEQYFYARYCLYCGAKMKGVENGKSVQM